MAKKKTGNSSAVSKSVGKGSGKFKRSTGKSKAVSKRSTGKVKAVAPRPSGHELVPVVCSECFGEFSFDTGVKSESIECPLCGHTSSRPDDQTLVKISGLQKGEKTSFVVAFFLFLLGVPTLLGWEVAMHNDVNFKDGGMFYGPLGLAVVLLIVLIVFIFKYEGNRWEVYF